MPSSIVYNLFEACQAQGCPICRLEAQSVERYLDSQFYENVNSPKWRDRLRASHGFCHAHAWLGVDRRLGDALGYSIIYRDVINAILTQLEDDSHPESVPRRKASWLLQLPDPARDLVEKMLAAFTPRKHCPVCEHRDETTRSNLAVLIEELKTEEMRNALQSSDGLCLPHLRLALEKLKSIDASAAQALLGIQRQKLENLRAELAEFIRKNDYQVIQEGFGKEGNAWLRAIAMIVGNRKR